MANDNGSHDPVRLRRADVLYRIDRRAGSCQMIWMLIALFVVLFVVAFTDIPY